MQVCTDFRWRRQFMMAENASVFNKHTTVEDLLSLKKKTILRDCLKKTDAKISGKKLELAERAYHINKNDPCHSLTASVKSGLTDDTDSSSAAESPECLLNDEEIPDIKTLNSGWTSDYRQFPRVTHKDLEQYLIHSRHRTQDCQRMQCYRQFIRGFNFYTEKYVQKVMVNLISDDSQLCFVRSKCHPSMKEGTYSQWILTTKSTPIRIKKAYCSCPAGLGEACTHISGLLFNLEASTISAGNEDEPCTSRPCEWSKPSKRKKQPDVVENIKFKRLKYGTDSTETHMKPFPPMISDSDYFRTRLCCKLSNIESNAVILGMIPPVSQVESDILSDLNVLNTVDIETTEHIVYESDKYVDVLELVKDMYSVEVVLRETSHIPESVIEELEYKTKGQNCNTLWQKARIARITSSNFHDILVRKPDTPPDKLLEKFMGKCSSVIDTPSLRWGRQNEPIAKKKYVAYKKLHDKEKVTVKETGLCLCKTNGFLGSSPDGIVISENNTIKKLLEIKCPYSVRDMSVLDECKMKQFCCYVNKSNKLCLKKNHRYYSQVQGQMGVCGYAVCDFVIYTNKDLKIVEVQFDLPYWNEMLSKLKSFYIQQMVPAMVKKEE